MAPKKSMSERSGAAVTKLAINSLAVWGITAILGVSLGFWAVVGTAVLLQVLAVSTTMHLVR